MIDSNNEFKKLSKGLLDAVRGVMEAKKVNKHGHDPVGKEDADIDNDGDVDKSDSYLHNRRKAIKASMKKEEVEAPAAKVSGLDIARNVLNKMRNEEVEELDELSVDKLKAYRAKARADAYDADDVDDERRYRKRAAGSNMAGKKIVRQGGSLKTEEVELDEALDAAARYGQHHTAIKDLMKSISQHIENHKSDALKHRDYRGKKGVHWGHVGDLAQVHSQLADIHDRLAQQGEYKKSLGESVEEIDIEHIDELSRGTLASYIKKAVPSKRGLEDSSDRLHQKGHDAYTSGATKTSDKMLSLSAKQYNKSLRRGEGINKAADKLAKEEFEQIDEISAKTVDSYREKAYAQQPAGDDGSSLYRKRKAGRDMAFKKVTHGAKVPATEEIELTQDEIDRLDTMMADLDEARGRPPKEGSAAWKARQAAAKSGNVEGDEPRQHIIQQLQRAKLSMQGGAKIRFKNGEEHHVHGTHAAKLLDKYAGMKPHEKETFQKKIGASHEGLKSEL